MASRVLACVIGVAIGVVGGAAGCAADDDRTVRPPGGGNGTPGDGGAGGADGGSGDGGTSGLSGTVCVVDDLRDLHGCPAINLRTDVLVEDVDRTVSTRSDNAGAFALALAGPTATLRLAADDELLAETLVDVAVGDGVEALVMDRTELEDTLLLLGAATGTAVVVVEVVDAAGDPVSGATVTIGGGADFPVAYDTPAGDFDALQAGTGPRGLALLIGATPGARTVGATDGAITGTDVVTCEDDVVTFARVVAQ
jgi:hypothetical protein